MPVNLMETFRSRSIIIASSGASNGVAPAWHVGWPEDPSWGTHPTGIMGDQPAMNSPGYKLSSKAGASLFSEIARG